MSEEGHTILTIMKLEHFREPVLRIAAATISSPADRTNRITMSLVAVFALSLFHAMAGSPAPVSIAPPPAQPLVAEVYDPGFPESDCSYHGVLCSQNGKVYFSLSAHSMSVWTRLYVFDPTTGKVGLFWTPQSIATEKDRVAQGKIHSPLAESADEIFFGTHSGHYKTSHALPDSSATFKPYPGGCVYAVNKETAKGRLVAMPLANRPITVPVDKEKVPLEGEALIGTITDAQRGLFYAVSWPSAIFAKVDLKTGKSQEYGTRQDGAESVPKNLGDNEDTKQPNPHYQRCLRTLGLDDEGNVYGSSGDGSIWRYDLQQDKIVTLKSRSEKGTAADLSKFPAYLNLWRTLVWDPKDKVFYGVHWASSWLFRFDPKQDTIEPVVQWGPSNLPVKDYAQLGLALGPNHVLYGLVHTAALKAGVQRSVHLITLDLAKRQLKDHGHILSSSGLTLMFAETCSAAPNGDVYATGWMEIPKEQEAAVMEKRKGSGVPEVRYPFLMELIRIPAKQINLTGP
jgi:hypothetical protein